MNFRTHVSCLSAGLPTLHRTTVTDHLRRAGVEVRQRGEDRIVLDGVAQLVADYQVGRSTKWFQRTYGLSQGAVLRLLDVNSVPRRPRGLSDKQVQKAIRLYAEGWSLTHIGNHFGKDHTVVRRALVQADVQLRHCSE